MNETTQKLTAQQKREMINEAWRKYRTAATALPRDLAWLDFLAADESLWRAYRTAEERIENAR